eukprot:9346692-Ditylum_brightwellii.AAC.1
MNDDSVSLNSVSSSEEDKSSSGSIGGANSLSNINDSKEEHELTTTACEVSPKHIAIGVADNGSLIEKDSAEAISMQEQLGDVNQNTEQEMFNENIRKITNLVVAAMTNFCSSEAIFN